MPALWRHGGSTYRGVLARRPRKKNESRREACWESCIGSDPRLFGAKSLGKTLAETSFFTRGAGKMPSCTSASNGTVSTYHVGDTLWKRSYGTVPACRTVSKSHGSCIAMARHVVSNLDSSSTTMTNSSQHGVLGPCRNLLDDMSSTWRQGSAITWPAWRGGTMSSYADVHDCILPVRHAGTKNFNGMLVYLGYIHYMFN